MIIDINGYKTEIKGLNPIVTGSTEDFTIYQNNLVEQGGIVTITANPIKEGVIEGYTEVQLPFEILNAQATALNVVGSAEECNGESAFIKITGSTLTIYATAQSPNTKEMKVSWTAKGVMYGL